MQHGKFVVVEFVRKKSMEILAKNWLKSEDVAFWPPYKEEGRRHFAAQHGKIPARNWRPYCIKAWLR